MLPSKNIFTTVGAILAATAVVVACGSEDESKFDDNPGGLEGGTLGPGLGDGGGPDGGDPYANDPPPKWCGPAGQPEPPKPGGTEACPDDKNKPGCGCTELGKKAACWTGLRANRGLGACKDGETTCNQISENVRAWGPCEGQVLPAAGATKGAAACRCFSEGQWKIANLSPAFITFNGHGAGLDGTYAVSTYLDGVGVAQVPTYPAGTPPPPTPEPGKIWSTDTLKVDCAGHFKLVLRIRQGVFESPQASDCILAEVTAEADYIKENVEQPWPDLPGWQGKSKDCAEKWRAVPANQSAGYAEMVVKGLSVRCDAIDDGAGGDFVFNRVKYCPATCRDPANASLPECVACQQSGQGTF